MKAIKTIIVATLIFLSINVKAQTNEVTYSYMPYKKSEIDTLASQKNASKVFVWKMDKYRAISFRLLNNNTYEQFHYTRKTIDRTDGGHYVISNKNILYLGTPKVPKWYSLKKYEKYFISPEGLHGIRPKGKVNTDPTYLYTTDERAYQAWNFNVISNKYYYGKQRWHWHINSYSKEDGGLGLFELIEKRFIKLSQQYIPEYVSLLSTSYAPIQDYEKEINNNYVRIKNDTSTIGLLAMLGTVIHESIHQKQFELSDEHFFGYYLPGEELKAKKNASIFKSEELFNSKTDSLVFYLDNINYSRIYTYLNGSVSSNINGIYGLLDEFSAYAHTAYINIKLLNKHITDSIFHDLVEQELDDVKSIPDNFYCFNYMIAWYLDFAQKNYPELYNELLANKELRETYTKINTFFEEQLEKYYEMEKSNTVLNTIYKQNKKYRVILEAYESKKPLLEQFKI